MPLLRFQPQEETMQDEGRSTQPVNFINFHGLTLLVVEHAGIGYVPARPLAELAGMQWKGAQRSLNEGDNAVLYGTVRLNPPVFAGQGTPGCPEKDITYIRLDRSRMFMARISTNNMRANGNAEGAEKVLALQTEWAEALHAYETQGIAVKSTRNSQIREINGLLRSIQLAKAPDIRAGLEQLLREELAALGATVIPSRQGELTV